MTRRLIPAVALCSLFVGSARAEESRSIRHDLRGIFRSQDDKEQGLLKQWAHSAKASSEFDGQGEQDEEDWNAIQACGKPDTEEDGDQATAWASMDPDGGEEWLELTYKHEIRPARVRVHETFNPGAVVKIEGQDAEKKWHVLWKGKDTNEESPGYLDVSFDPPAFATRVIRVTLDTESVEGWNEIDAVQLIGKPPAGTETAQDKEEIKKNILAMVKKRLAEERARILEQIGKLLDEELSRQKPADKPSGDKPPAPAAGDKKAREIERKLAELDEQRDELLHDLRAIKRGTEDAKIIEDARKNPPEDGQAIQEEFQEYFQAHTDEEFKDSIKGFKRLYYALHDSDNRGMRRFAAMSAYNVCCGYALSQDKEQSLDWLEISIKAGFNSAQDFAHMRQDTDLDSLRQERRYLKLMADR
ncbi:MAG: hypothetical protein HY716_10845 [Planctomycetes bacterium]|nr:hypothetical protein [Planctomycetota bacterium]